MKQTPATALLAFRTPDGQRCGEDRFALLSAIESCGTLSGAAKQVGLSYKAAWDGMNAMNNLFARPLVLKQTGGRNGGRCELTAEGIEALKVHRALQKALSETLAHLSERLSGDQTVSIPSFFGIPAMKTTARNTFYGRICRITEGAVNTEVCLDISKSFQLNVMITNHSMETLGLNIGSEVFALIKASTPVLMAHKPSLKTSARNQLSGPVQHIEIGSVNAEVILDLGAGKTLTAIVTKDSVKAMDITPGTQLVALIKSSQIILAAP